MTFANVDESLTMDGLGSTKSYLVLRRKKRLGIHVGFRPLVGRISDDAIIIGGKLRIAYDSTYGEEGHSPKPISPEVAVKTLRNTFDGSGVLWHRVDPRRVSAVVAKPVAAGLWNGKEFKEKVKIEEFVDELLEHIQGAVGFKMENQRKIREALRAYYEGAVNAVFQDLPSPKKLDEKLVGVSGAVAVAEGGDMSSSKKVISFLDKLAAKQAKAAAH